MGSSTAGRGWRLRRDVSYALLSGTNRNCRSHSSEVDCEEIAISREATSGSRTSKFLSPLLAVYYVDARRNRHAVYASLEAAEMQSSHVAGSWGTTACGRRPISLAKVGPAAEAELACRRILNQTHGALDLDLALTCVELLDDAGRTSITVLKTNNLR